jgi:hypothetical protein
VKAACDLSGTPAANGGLLPASIQLREFLRMKTTKLALAIMLATGLAAAPFAAQAKSHKAKHGSSMSHSQTTGANTKASGAAANPSSQGNVGPGTNQAGSLNSPSGTK